MKGQIFTLGQILGTPYPHAGPANSAHYECVLSEDFLGGGFEIGNNGWWTDTGGGAGGGGGGGTFVAVGQETSSSIITTGHPGVIYLATGFANTVIGDEFAIAHQEPEGLLLAGGTIVECIFHFQSIQTSPGTTSYPVYQLGLFDATTYADVVDGVWLEYDPSGSANFRMCTSSNSSRTRTPSSVAVSATPWYRAVLVQNQANTSAGFFLSTDKAPIVKLGSVSATLPTGSGRNCGPALRTKTVKVGSSSLTGTASMNVDAYRLYIPVVR